MLHNDGMPSFPTTQCGQTRCKNPAAKGKSLCVEHAPTIKRTEERIKANAKYNSSAWDSIRMRQLSLSPLCQACKQTGQITLAAHVDHVFPWQHIGPAAFRRNLFQSLCARCHGVKSSYELKGIYRHYTDAGILEYKTTDYQGVIHAYTTAPHYPDTARTRYLESADFRDRNTKRS
jgi:5-methylcytosine-specific restriction endonuclease McrA